MFDTVIRGGTIVDGTGAAPYTGDVAIEGDRIVAVGPDVDGARAKQTIDADGALVTPGFIDLHTHYDGQVTWDDALEPSATNGITTIVLGNCGVGFAPVRPSDHEQLIDMMEGVEDIPGSALVDGMPWGEWETFGDYLDVLGNRRYAANVAAHIAHGPVRYYVMGERAYDDQDATPEEVEQMARIVGDAFAAGAAGFSSNRFRAHRSRSGKIVPGTFAAVDELKAIAGAVGRAGHGVLQAIADGTITPDSEDKMPDLDMLAGLAGIANRPLTFSTFQASAQSGVYQRVLDGAATWNAKGVQLRPQIIPRAVTFMTSLASYHPFMNRPTYKALADRPLHERVARMRQPEIRQQILTEKDEITGGLGAMMGVMLGNAVGRLFSLAFPVDYEPAPDQSVKARARAAGVEPLELLYDEMTAGDGTTFFALLGNNFHEGTLEPCRDMLLDPNTVSGLSDAGAHVMMISDCSASTFHLTHWVRDRTKGERVPLELAVHKLTGAPAAMYGFADRGTLTPGKKADVNVIDFDALTIEAPTTRADLPTGASRILQRSTGYLATIANGATVRRHDTDTGARPGYLLRSGQATS
jgi:N-acyl-D-aspartate/D-glutamate deacylase